MARWSVGLDQLIPPQNYKSFGFKKSKNSVVSLKVRATASTRARKVKITLPTMESLSQLDKVA